MKIYNTKEDIWCYLIAYLEIMVISLYGDVLPQDSEMMAFIKNTFALIRENAFFYALNFVLLLAGIVYLLNRQLERKVFRAGRCVAWGVSAVMVVVCTTKHPKAIEYLALLFSYFILGFLIELSKCISCCSRESKGMSEKNGFVADSSQQGKLQNVGWDKYAESLLVRLDATNLQNASFAVALTGSWGTGKTTFLGYMKSEMEKRGLYYMEFNPWLSNSAHTVIQDFFDSLNGKIKEFGIELEDEIDEYVKILFKWKNESFAEKVSDVLHLEEKQSLASLREQLSEGLKMLDGKLYILIDDLDRLQAAEIFEVLKLIRNTADFNNVVYVVPFDKEYVLASLNAFVEKQNEYLKKIFQLELKFPKYEGYLLTHLFNTDLLKHSRYDDADLQNQLNHLEMLLSNDNIYLRDYLENFRDAKRLVNEFILNLDYIYRQGVVADFNIKELFLILLFEFTDEKGFEVFQDNMWNILHVNSSDSKYVELKDNDTLAKYILSMKSQSILKVLFPAITYSKPKPSRNSIRRQDKILTYFSFRPYAYQMSLTEFSDLIRSSSADVIVSYVEKSNVGVFSKASSIYQIMSEQSLNRLDEPSIKNFLILLMEWTKKYQEFPSDDIGSLYRNVLLKDRVDAHRIDLVKNILNPFFASLQEPQRGFYVLQKILCKMVPCFVQQNSDGDDEYYPECIYGINELRNMISENTNTFLNLIKPGIDQLMMDSRLHVFIRNSIVYNESFTRPQFESFAIENELIAYFSQNKTTNDIRPFILKFDVDNYWGDTIEEKLEAMQSDIRKSFASIGFYVRFLKDCFEFHDDDYSLDDYFRRNRLVVK